MEQYQQRVIEEKVELDHKRDKLRSFQNTDFFEQLPWQEKERMKTQLHVMTMYSVILADRIANF